MAWTDIVSSLFGSRMQNSVVSAGDSDSWTGSLPGFFGSSPAAGMRLSVDQAMSVSAVYACTRARAEILASLPGMVFVELDDNVRRRHSDNPLWRLLHDAPNPEMDSMTFYELLQTRVVSRGNGLALIERDRRDIPIHLWPVHNSRVELQRDDSGELYWRVYSDYFDRSTDRLRWRDIPDRDMLNVVGFGSNGYKGTGVIPVAVEEISLNVAMTQYGGSFFKSGAKPVGFVEHPKFYDTKKQRREFREDMNRVHAGSENWNQIGVLWDGAKFKEMQYSPEQSQFIASRGYSAKQICSFFNVPPALVQIFDDYKFSTVDAMIQQFVMTCVRSDAIRLERAIKRQVVHTQGFDRNGQMVQLFKDPYVFEFIIEALLRGDPKKQAETLEIERRNGIRNANQWRALKNEEPLPGEQGEKYIVPGGFEDLSKLGQTYPSGSKSAGGSDNSPKSIAFDREQLIRSLEPAVPKHRDRSPGAIAEDATTLRDELSQAAIEVLQEANQRLGKVLAKELARVEKTGSSSERIDQAWAGHCQRLQNAFLPGCKVFCRYRSQDAETLAESLAARLCDGCDSDLELTLQIVESCCDEIDAG